MSDAQDAWIIRVLGVDPSVLAASGVDPAATANRAAANRAAADVPASAKGAVAYAKSRLAWIATRQSVDAQFNDFVQSLADQYADEGADNVVRDLLRARLVPVMATLDDTLADRLDDVVNEADPVRRETLVGEARSIIAEYQDFVLNEEMFAAMDRNPFAPTVIQKTLLDTLQTLSAAVR